MYRVVYLFTDLTWTCSVAMGNYPSHSAILTTVSSTFCTTQTKKPLQLKTRGWYPPTDITREDGWIRMIWKKKIVRKTQDFLCYLQSFPFILLALSPRERQLRKCLAMVLRGENPGAKSCFLIFPLTVGLSGGGDAKITKLYCSGCYIHIQLTFYLLVFFSLFSMSELHSISLSFSLKQ